MMKAVKKAKGARKGWHVACGVRKRVKYWNIEVKAKNEEMRS